MENHTEVVFEDIEQRILKEIENAHYSIFVSVAWFTNKRLFNALLEKARANCYVSIIIQLDEINSQCGLDYNQIQIGRSECFKISKDAELLHDKFCVIDFKTVITGSYNWTYKAALNSENVIISNDPSLASRFISRFEQQKAKYKKSSVTDHDQTTSCKSITQCTPAVTPKPDIAPAVVISKRLCQHCNKEISNNVRYCPDCGTPQNGFQHRSQSITVTCQKCSRKQEEALIDAVGTKFCTFCGSDKLEWKVE